MKPLGGPCRVSTQWAEINGGITYPERVQVGAEQLLPQGACATCYCCLLPLCVVTCTTKKQMKPLRLCAKPRAT